MMKGIISALVATGLSVSSSASPSRSHVYVLPTKAQVLISQPASAHVYIKWIVGRSPIVIWPTGVTYSTTSSGSPAPAVENSSTLFSEVTGRRRLTVTLWDPICGSYLWSRRSISCRRSHLPPGRSCSTLNGATTSTR